MELFDTHCHLQASVLQDLGEGLYDRAQAAGVAGFFVMATEPGDWRWGSTPGTCPRARVPPTGCRPSRPG
jgi:Tat protein secretion system quality control protein TatD with DNase activity